MLRPNRLHRKVQKLQEGGYISQIGKTIGKTSLASGVLPQIGTALDQAIPGLTLTYKPIERALPPDLASIPIALKAESSKVAAEKQKAGQDVFTKAIADKGFKPWQQAKLQSDMQAVRDEIKNNLTSDPNYYSSSLNAHNLESSLNSLVSSERMSVFQNQLKEIESMQNHIKAEKIGENTYLDADNKVHYNPRTGKQLTYNEYLNTISTGAASDPFVQELLQTSKRPEGFVSFYKGAGQIPEDVTSEIAKFVNAVKPDTVTRGGDIKGIDLQQADAANIWANFKSYDKTFSSTEKKMNALSTMLKTNWRDLLGPRAQYAVEEEGRKKFLNSQWDYNGEKMSGAALMQGDDKMKAFAQQKQEAQTNNVINDIIKNQTDLGRVTTDIYKTQSNRERVVAPAAPDSGGVGAGADGEILDRPTILDAQSYLATSKDAPLTFGFAQDKVNIPIIATSTKQPDATKTFDKVNITAATGYDISQQGWTSSRTAPLPLNYNLVGATHQKNVVVPVYTGIKIAKDGSKLPSDPNVKSILVSDGTAGDAKRHGVPMHFEGGGPPKVRYDKDWGYNYVEDDKGNRYVVENKSFEVWSGKQEGMLDKDVTILKPDDKSSSQVKYEGRNFSDEKNEDYIRKKKDAKNRTVLEPTPQYDTAIKAYTLAMQNRFQEELATNKEQIEADPDIYKAIHAKYAQALGGESYAFDGKKWKAKTYKSPLQLMNELRDDPFKSQLLAKKINAELANYENGLRYKTLERTLPQEKAIAPSSTQTNTYTQQ